MALPFTCPIHSLCESPENPFANLSAELSDGPIYIGRYNPVLNGNINPTNNGGGSGDPITRPWVGDGCYSTCENRVSQEEADLCAQRHASSCQSDPPAVMTEPPGDAIVPFVPPEPPLPDPTQVPDDSGHPPPPPPIPDVPAPTRSRLSCNQEQVACVACGDGSQFCFVVPACTFFGRTVFAANAMALSYATTQANKKRICLGSITDTTCNNQPYSSSTDRTGGTAPFSFSIIDGDLPPGVFINSSTGLISGTPTAVGLYLFTVRCTDSLGSYMNKDYEIDVQDCAGCMITESTLPVFYQGQAYSQQLHVTGGTAPFSFALVEGVLPQGLSISPTGMISGTAALVNGNLDQTFTVQVTDSSTPSQSCEKALTLPIFDYHDFPPGLHWRIKTYVDGTLNSACCQVCGVCNTWDGSFITHSGAADFRGNPTTAGIVNHITSQKLALVLFGPSANEWTIQIFCPTIFNTAVWIGTKVGSNQGSKLDSPAGTYTINNWFGYGTVCDASLTLTIESF